MFARDRVWEKRGRVLDDFAMGAKAHAARAIDACRDREVEPMNVISSAAADGFIQRLPKEIRFYLVHGPDEGLAHERVKAIIRNLIDARIRTRCGWCASTATRSRAIRARLPTKPMRSRCSAARARSGSTRRRAICCRRWSRCSPGRRPIARSSSRPDHSGRERACGPPSKASPIARVDRMLSRRRARSRVRSSTRRPARPGLRSRRTRATTLVGLIGADRRRRAAKSPS